MAFARELAHIVADLCQYSRRRVLSHARYGLQKFHVQDLHVGPEMPLYPFVQLFDDGPPVPDTGPYGREHEPMVFGKVPLERACQALPARLHLSVAQFYQFPYILLAAVAPPMSLTTLESLMLASSNILWIRFFSEAIWPTTFRL